MRQPVPYPRRHVVWDSLLVMVAFLATSSLTFVRDLLTAYYFGLTEVVDAYLIAALPINQAIVVLGSNLGPVFIPKFIEHQANPYRYSKLLFSSAIVVVFATSLISLLLFFYGKYLLAYSGQQLPPPKQILAHDQFLVMLLCIIPSALGYLLVAALNAQRAYLASVLLPALPQACAILGLYIWGTRFSTGTLVWGMVIGSALFCCISWLLLKTKLQIMPIRHLQFKLSSEIMSSGRGLLFVISNALISATGALVEQVYAASAIINGVSTLNYASRLPLFLNSLGSALVSNVFLSRFSEMLTSTKTFQHKPRQLYAYLAVVFISSMVVCAVLGLYSEKIVSLIFARGMFDEKDTKIVAFLQRIYLIGTPFLMTGIIGLRYLNALRNNGAVLSITASMYAAHIFGCVAFTSYYGLIGIAFSYSIMLVVFCIMVCLWLFRPTFMLR